MKLLTLFLVLYSYNMFSQSNITKKISEEVCSCLKSKKNSSASDLNACFASSYLTHKTEIEKYLNLKIGTSYEESKQAGKRLRDEVLVLLRNCNYYKK